MAQTQTMREILTSFLKAGGFVKGYYNPITKAFVSSADLAKVISLDDAVAVMERPTEPLPSR